MLRNLTLIGLLILAGTARADDKAIPASINCYASSYGNGALPLRSATSWSLQYAGMGITCSIPRDNTLNTSGLLDLEIRASYTQGVGNTLECTASSYSEVWALLDSETRQFTVPANGPPVAFVLDFGTSINVSTSSSYYSVTCTKLGNNSGSFSVRGIYFDEP